MIKNLPLLLLLFVLITNLSSKELNTYDSLTIELDKIKSQTNIDSKDKRIINLLNKLYEETLQADSERLSKSAIDEYKAFQTDKTLANRHIFYLFNTYQDLFKNSNLKTQKSNYSLQIALMKLLSRELLSLYNEIPPIVIIYMGEALMNANLNENAKNHFSLALQFYPTSIPIKVYNYLLSNNDSQKNKLLYDLKTSHPNHWMVKGLK